MNINITKLIKTLIKFYKKINFPMKVEQFWQKNKIKVGITAGIIAVGALSYWLYRKYANDHN